MSSPKSLAFQFFPLLPKELRLQIWEDVVPQERMIRISLQPHEGRRYDLAAAEPRYLRRNHLKNPISGERYRAVVYGRYINSKFLRVNSEARNVALGFYRVHFPVYMTGPTHTQRSTLYFNPEHDFLHIWADAPVKETLVDFLWDLKAYDPKSVGLRKLGIDLDGFCANDLQYLRKSDLLLVRQRNVLVETLAHLSDVWFINMQAASRALKPQRMLGHTPRRHFINGGPVLRDMPTFQRLGADQRNGLDKELQDVYMGEVDPREILFRWRRLLRTWGIDYESGQVDYRLFIGNIPLTLPTRQSMTVGKAKQAMQSLTLKDDEAKSPRQDLDSETRTAVTGFWLFPLGAIGELGEGEKLADMNFLPRRVLDLRSYRPELVLSKPN